MTTSAWHALADPWAEPIMRHALLEVTFAGAACGALGVWVVLYGLSYGAESLAHSMFPGLAVAALVGIPLVLGGAGGLGLAGAGVAPGWPGRGSRGRAASAASAPTTRWPWWSRACSAWARCWRSSRPRRRGCSRCC